MTDSQEGEEEHEGSRPRDRVPSAFCASAEAPRALASAADSGRRARPAQPQRRSSPPDPDPAGSPVGGALGFASCASFHEPPAACHLGRAPTSALRSISLEGYSKDDFRGRLRGLLRWLRKLEKPRALRRKRWSDGAGDAVRFWRAGGRVRRCGTEADQSALAKWPR
jgi:hypothetical protein